MTESFEPKLRRLLAEQIEIVPYDPAWPVKFQLESDHLRTCLPAALIGRIEHMGSTAVPGLAAKPIIDMLVEVTDLDLTRERIVPILEGQGYDYFWRPTVGDDGAPFYAWFIKRDPDGNRTHHIHMVEAHFEHWNRLRFRDYLIENPSVAREYQELKFALASKYPNDRVRYTNAKTSFILRITEKAGLSGTDD